MADNPYQPGTFAWAVWHVDNDEDAALPIDGGYYALSKRPSNGLILRMFIEFPNRSGVRYAGDVLIEPAHVFATNWELE